MRLHAESLAFGGDKTASSKLVESSPRLFAKNTKKHWQIFDKSKHKGSGEICPRELQREIENEKLEIGSSKTAR